MYESIRKLQHKLGPLFTKLKEISMNKPRILFIYDHPNPDMWLDGLSAALDLLEEDFEIERRNLYSNIPYNGQNPSDSVHDFVLGWGAFGSKVDIELQKIIGNRGEKDSASQATLLHQTVL